MSKPKAETKPNQRARRVPGAFPLRRPKPDSPKPVNLKPANLKPASSKLTKPKLVASKGIQSRTAPKTVAQDGRDNASRKFLKAVLPGQRPMRVRKLEQLAAPRTAHKISDLSTAQLRMQVRRLTAQLVEARGRIKDLEDRADTDVLLNILNRRGFERELNRALAHIKRYRATGALIALDVDHLKPINDTLGHAAGDAVLKGVTDVILRHVRSSDLVGRLGGDEFAILLWNLSEADAQAKATALEDAIDRLTFVFRGQPMSSGASTGIAIIAPTDTAAEVLERADLAMYKRKRKRRDRSQ